MSKYLKKATRPFEIDPRMNVADLVEAMEGTAFQAKNLATAADIWKRMLKGETTVFLGLSGAMVPAGMRPVIRYLIEKRMIDCLVSTGANLFHDAHETLGNFHWQGSSTVDDMDLKRHRVNRIYDVFACEEEFNRTDKYIASFASTLSKTRPYTTREFLYLLGGALASDAKAGGMLTAAHKAKVPVYCPAIGDSSIAISLLVDHHDAKIVFDAVADIEEMARIVMDAKATGVIYVGGGTPKNFIQQTEVTAPFLGRATGGHAYAIQITCDSPQWGGLSGCTFEEGQSWGKISEGAFKVTVYSDATIAFPVIVTAVAQRAASIIKKRRLPSMRVFGKRH